MIYTKVMNVLYIDASYKDGAIVGAYTSADLLNQGNYKITCEYAHCDNHMAEALNLLYVINNVALEGSTIYMDSKIVVDRVCGSNRNAKNKQLYRLCATLKKKVSKMNLSIEWVSEEHHIMSICDKLSKMPV